MIKKAVKKVVKSRVEKPFNHGTLSQAGFFGMLRSCMRNKSRFWKPIQECKKLARRGVKGKGAQKWEYKCNDCGKYFMDKEIAIDHIIEAGELKCFEDLAGFAKRLFVEISGFQVLCNNRLDGKESCHKRKTDAYMKGKKLKPIT